MPPKLSTEDHTAVNRPRLQGSAAMLVAVGGLAIAGLTGLALAKTAPTLSSAKSSTIGKTIVVDSHGLTVYELSPDTSHNLLCTKAAGCFGPWPPVTVSSAKTRLAAGTTVTGKLGILRRNGIVQLTLGGKPLYHFAGDQSKRGMSNGQGIRSFGGTRHVAAASAHGAPTMTMPPATTTSATTPYPQY